MSLLSVCFTRGNVSAGTPMPGNLGLNPSRKEKTGKSFYLAIEGDARETLETLGEYSERLIQLYANSLGSKMIEVPQDPGEDQILGVHSRGIWYG